MQNGKKVVDNLLRNKKAQRMGTQELIWEDTIRKWIDQGYPKDSEGKPVDYIQHFDLDMANIGGWFDLMPLRGHEEIVRETEDWLIKKNGAGASLKFWKNKSGVPEHIDFTMTSQEIWERDYRKYILDLDTKRVDLDFARKMTKLRNEQDCWTFYGHLFVFENLRQSVGDFCLYETVLTNPGWFHDYNRVYTDFFKKHYKYLFDNVGLPDGIWVYEDMGYKGSLFCSPNVFQELFFPYYRELIEFFHSYDLPVVLHSCGYIEQILDMIVDVGFDALNPMEVKAGCDVLRFAEKYADKLAFVGGLDIRILEGGDKAVIKKEVLRLVNGMKERNARFLFSTDHSVSTAVKYEDYKYALQVFTDNMYY